MLDFDDFDWDENNEDKIVEKHHLNRWEIQEAFYNQPQKLESFGKDYYHFYGRSNGDKLLFIAFSVVKKRGLKLVRPITAYEMDKSKRKKYKKSK
ncbi:MAG TPA: hypothetical protein VGK02_01425 [Candidatus Aquicultor sp.]